MLTLKRLTIHYYIINTEEFVDKEGTNCRKEQKIFNLLNVLAIKQKTSTVLWSIIQMLKIKANSFLKWGFIENSKNTRILLGNCISKFPDKSWNFLENLGISKINFGFFKKNFWIFHRDFSNYREYCFSILEIPRFSRKFQDLSGNFEMQLPRRILVFFEFSIKHHFKKEFAFNH